MKYRSSSPQFKLKNKYPGNTISKIPVQTPRRTKSKEIEALRIIAQAQNGSVEPQETELRMATAIRDLFCAEDILMILMDEEYSALAIRKRLGRGLRTTWLAEDSILVKHSLKEHLVGDHQFAVLDEVCSDLSFGHSSNNDQGNGIESVLCAPMIIKSKHVIGSLVLVNPPDWVKLDKYRDLLSVITNVLANFIHSSHLLFKIKISNADLEASKWELLHSRNTLRALFDSLPSSIYIIDTTYNLIAINFHRSNRANLPPNRLVGHKCYERLYDRAEPCSNCLAQDTLASGHNTQRFRREQPDSDRSIEWEVKTFPILDRRNLPVQAIVVEEDVTEKRHLEANLIQSEKMALVGQLAAGIAHEINNPLTAILANVQMIERDPGTSQADLVDALSLIKLAGTRAAQVVNNLLGIARKETYDFSLTHLNESLHVARALVQHELTRLDVHLQMDLQDSMPLMIASKDHLQAIWINLILNALDALDKERKLIRVASSYDAGEFRIDFSDNGKGIPPAQLGKVFEPFFTTKTPGRGTGLGLYLCTRVVEQHHGKIFVESQAGKWTRFTVIIPDQSAGLSLPDQL